MSKFYFVKKQIAPFVSTSRELSFEWSHHRFLPADSKVRVTLQNSIKHSGRERVESCLSDKKIYSSRLFLSRECVLIPHLVDQILKVTRSWQIVTRVCCCTLLEDVMNGSRYVKITSVAVFGIQNLSLWPKPSILYKGRYIVYPVL